MISVMMALRNWCIFAQTNKPSPLFLWSRQHLKPTAESIWWNNVTGQKSKRSNIFKNFSRTVFALMLPHPASHLKPNVKRSRQKSRTAKTAKCKKLTGQPQPILKCTLSPCTIKMTFWVQGQRCTHFVWSSTVYSIQYTYIHDKNTIREGGSTALGGWGGWQDYSIMTAWVIRIWKIYHMMGVEPL